MYRKPRARVFSRVLSRLDSSSCSILWFIFERERERERCALTFRNSKERFHSVRDKKKDVNISRPTGTFLRFSLGSALSKHKKKHGGCAVGAEEENVVSSEVLDLRRKFELGGSLGGIRARPNRAQKCNLV